MMLIKLLSCVFHQVLHCLVVWILVIEHCVDIGARPGEYSNGVALRPDEAAEFVCSSLKILRLNELFHLLLDHIKGLEAHLGYTPVPLQLLSD